MEGFADGIRDIQAEVEELTKIRGAFDSYQEKEREVDRLRYFQSALEVLELRELETSVRMQVKNHQEDVKKQELNQKELEKTIGKLEEEKEKLIGKINASGYEELLASLKNLYELQSSYGEGVKNWQDTVRRLKEWEEQEITPNPVLWKIESFEKGTIPEEELKKLREEFDSIQKDVRRQKSEAESEIRRIRREKKEAEDTLKELRQGSAAYPKELEEARSILRRELQKKAGHPVPVEILADLLEVRDDAWRNAVEGYMAGNKLRWWCRRDMRRMRWKFTGAWTKRNISKWQSWIRRKCQKSAGKYVPGHCRRRSRQKMNLCGHMWTFSWVV